jgi:hypothetical protein
MYLLGLYRKSGIYNAVRNIKSVTEVVCEYNILLNKRLLNCDEYFNPRLGTMRSGDSAQCLYFLNILDFRSVNFSLQLAL